MNVTMELKTLHTLLLTMAIALMLGSGARAQGGLVISQFYGGGGNAGSPSAPIKYDYVELYNNSTSALDVSGYSIQYGSATGTTFGSNPFVLASGTTVQGRSYYLVKLLGSSTGNGTDFVSDATDTRTNGINASATAGKVALANNANVVTFAAGSNMFSTNVVDFLGYGTTANAFEGTGPAPAPSNTTALFRALVNSQYVDTNNNMADFTTGAPMPRNSSGMFEPTPAPPGLASLLIGLCVSGWKARRRKRQVAEDVTADAAG